MRRKKSLIFIVEDDVTCAKLLRYCLQNKGYNNTRIFTNEQECLDNMDLEPKILITDYLLKYEDGLKLIQRAKELHPFLYSILLSGLNKDEILYRNKEAKYVDRYIKKGHESIERLIETVENYLEESYVNQTSAHSI